MSLEQEPAQELAQEPAKAPDQAPADERVRSQLAELEDIEHRPLPEHAERYDRVHAELQAALSDIDGAAEG